MLTFRINKDKFTKDKAEINVYRDSEETGLSETLDRDGHTWGAFGKTEKKIVKTFSTKEEAENWVKIQEISDNYSVVACDDKYTMTCECENIDELRVGSIVSAVNNITLTFSDNVTGDTTNTYTFYNDYEVQSVSESEGVFTFLVDKMLNLPVKTVASVEYDEYNEMTGEMIKVKYLYLTFSNEHYFDNTDISANTIKLYFKYVFNGEVRTLVNNDFKFLTPNVLRCELTPEWFDTESEENDLYFSVFGVRRFIENTIEGNPLLVFRDTLLFGERSDYQLFYVRSLVGINIPLKQSFETNMFQSEALKTKFVDEEKRKAINPIVDMEKDIYYPVCKHGEEQENIYTIKFNLHFRQHRDPDWLAEKTCFWNGNVVSYRKINNPSEELTYNEYWGYDVYVKYNDENKIIGVKNRSEYEQSGEGYEKKIISPEQYVSLPKETKADSYSYYTIGQDKCTIIITEEERDEYESIADMMNKCYEEQKGYFSMLDESLQSDLLSYLDFGNDDIKFQKNRLKKSFLRLSFYDSDDQARQNLLAYSTVFLDSGNLFNKYIKNIEREPYSLLQEDEEYTTSLNKVGIRTNREPYKDETNVLGDKEVEDYRLSCQFVVKDKHESKSSSEGFYVYLWKDNEAVGLPKELYMKVEFNHAGYGRTVPFMMPYWDKEKYKYNGTVIRKKQQGIKSFQEILDDWNSIVAYREINNPTDTISEEDYDRKNKNEKSNYFRDWKTAIDGENYGTDGRYGIRRYLKYSYIKLKYMYDSETKRHIYYLDNDIYGSTSVGSCFSDGTLMLNLYEAKVE